MKTIILLSFLVPVTGFFAGVGVANKQANRAVTWETDTIYKDNAPYALLLAKGLAL